MPFLKTGAGQNSLNYLISKYLKIIYIKHLVNCLFVIAYEEYFGGFDCPCHFKCLGLTRQRFSKLIFKKEVPKNQKLNTLCKKLFLLIEWITTKKKENLYLIILWSNLTHVYKSWVNDLWNTGMTYNMTEYATNKTFYGCI